MPLIKSGRRLEKRKPGDLPNLVILLFGNKAMDGSTGCSIPKNNIMKTLPTSAMVILLFGSIAFAQNNAVVDSLSTATVTTNYLDEVVLSDTRLPIKRSQSGREVIKIDKKQLERFNGRSVAELLSVQSGITIIGNQSITGQNLRFAVRGSTNNQVLILVDGIRVSDPSRIGSDFDLNFLSLDDIESIEILKGGASTLYGSAAAAGVINITTKSVTDERHFQINLQNGTEQTQNEILQGVNYFSNSTSFADKIRNLNYKLGFSSLNVDGMSAVDAGDETDAFFRYNLNAQLGQKFDQFSWKLMASKAQIKNEYDNIFPIEDAEFLGFSFMEQLAFNAIYRYTKGEVNLDMSKQLTQREYRDNYPSQYDANTTTIELINRYRFNDELSSIQGLLFQEGSYEGVPAVQQKDVFVNFVYTSDFGLNLNVGGRLNHHDTYGDFFTYSLNPSYIVDVNAAQLKLFGSLSTAFVAPSLFQLYDTYSGNVNLQPEESQSNELGLSFSHDDAHSSLVYFHRKEDPKIMYDLITYAYANASSNVEYLGVEFMYANRLFDRVNLSLNYTFTELKDGNPVRLAKHMFNSVVEYQDQKTNTFGLVFTYRGERQAVDQTYLDAYSLIDLRYAKHFLDGKLTASFWINNLFDKEFVELANFTTKGRNIRFGINYSL